MHTSTLEAARYWQSLNLNVLPAQPNSKYLFKGSRINGNLLTFPKLVKYFHKTRNNIVLVPGKANNGLYLVVLDFDDMTDYANWLNKSTYEVTTKHGKHCYFWLRNEPIGDPVGCELKYKQAVTIPPSMVKSHKYTGNGKDILIVDNLADCVSLAAKAAALRAHNVEKEKPIIDSLNGIRSCFSFPRCTDGDSRPISFQDVKRAIPVIHYLEIIGNDDKFISVYCPLHQADQTGRQSLSVNTELNLVKCFNSKCKLSQKWFDVIGLHAALNGIDNKESALDLAENFVP